MVPPTRGEWAMNLNFLSPIFLFGLLGIAIPILIHLMTRRQKKYIRFSAVYLLFQSKKIYNNNKFLAESSDFKIKNETLEIKSESVESKYDWNHFIKLKEDNNFYLLYQTDLTAVFLKKKLFKEKDLFEFDTFLNSLRIKCI